MKRFNAVILMLAVVAMVVSGCGYTKIPLGYEGVLVNTLGDDKGGIETKGVGRHFYSIKYEMKKFPLFKQNYVWTASATEGSENNEAITFQSKESMSFTADVGISFSCKKGRAGELYRTYHKGIEEITDIDMRNTVRDAFNMIASGLSVDDIYGKGKAAFLQKVEDHVRLAWADNVEVHNVYLVGKIVPPPEVERSISKKIEATQIAIQRRNEVEQEKANADKKIEEARGTAESIKLKAEAEAYSIQVVEKQLSRSPRYIEYIKAQKWDGKLPQFMGGDDVMPMISLNSN